MKKQVFTVSALAAALTLSTGFNALADGWVDENGRKAYVYDNGNRAGFGWFTDPATGLQYHLDYDGYAMTGTRVDGFWLDDQGVKHEKTETEIAQENARKEELASRPSPAKAQANATQAAALAKTTGIAASTFRMVYQKEYKALMDLYYIDTFDKLKAMENTTITRFGNDDFQETTYVYNAEGKGRLISSSLYKVTSNRNYYYKPYALELSFNRSYLSTQEETDLFQEMFRKLVVGALGENQGKAVYDRCFAEQVGAGVSFDHSATTDTGNSYVLTYQNDIITIQVTCLEKTLEVPETASEENAEGNTENADNNASDGTAENADSNTSDGTTENADENVSDGTTENTN